ncbi:MAG TPA: S53 family serine peptidase [Steroidobacteraceae bacterium]|nr:S53 family serine peptidase [Steroidobacteraceae bacterium]
MRIRSLITGAVLAALSLTALQLPQAAAAPGMQSFGAANPSAVTEFSVYLPLTHTDALEQMLRDQTDSKSASYHRWLTPEQFKERFGPSPADVARTRAMLEANGFTILKEQTQNLRVQGPVSAVERLFSTRIEQVRTPQGQMKYAAANHGRLNLPQALAAMGAVIPEFAPHLSAHVHSRHLAAGSSTQPLTAGGTGRGTQDRLANDFSFFYANDLREAYQVPSFQATVPTPFNRHPSQLAGAGATIGIVISSVIDPVDLGASFNSTVSIGPIVDVQNYTAVSGLPSPTVTIRPVDGGSGKFNPNTADGAEASLDTQMSLGTAPLAKEIVYDMHALSDADIIDAYTAVDEDNLVDVVSSSFGECEQDFLAINNGGTDFTPILKQFHALFQQGNAQGITFLASSGDSGAPACLSTAFQNNPTNGTDFVLGVENPADDPNVTSVGGTNLQTAATPTVNDVTRVSENADFDPRLPAEFQLSDGSIVSVGNNTWGSGGGFSVIFNKPFYQFLVNTGSAVHRAVPDVSLMMGGCPGDADIATQDCTLLPRSAVIVWIGERPALLVGTSSSSPEMAGVLALAVELNHGRLGNVNPLIYALSLVQTLAGGAHAPKALQYFHRDISGNNNGFKVSPGQAYSEVLGNSTLDVRNFLQLPFITPSGAPGTPSNP